MTGPKHNKRAKYPNTESEHYQWTSCLAVEINVLLVLESKDHVLGLSWIDRIELN